MNKGANTPNSDPQVAGLGEKQLPTQEQSISHTYFAGVRNLKCIWIMQPVDQKTVETSTPKMPKLISPVALDFLGGGTIPGAGWLIKDA